MYLLVQPLWLGILVADAECCISFDGYTHVTIRLAGNVLLGCNMRWILAPNSGQYPAIFWACYTKQATKKRLWIPSMVPVEIYNAKKCVFLVRHAELTYVRTESAIRSVSGYLVWVGVFEMHNAKKCELVYRFSYKSSILHR